MSDDEKNYEEKFDTVAKRIPKTLKAQFKSPKAFWKSLGEMYGVMAGYLTREELEAIKTEFPLAYEFVEDCL